MIRPPEFVIRVAPLLIVCCAVASQAEYARAQAPVGLPAASAQSVVAGSGIVTIERLPTRMRVTVNLLGRSGDLKTALAKLADRREAARIQLTVLKADEASVKIGEPTLSAASGQQQQQMEQMIMQQLRMRRRGGPIPKLPQIVTVKSTLSAEWPLDAKDTESLLIQATELQAKINAADLGGAKEKPDLTPEQAELLEEIAQMRNEYGENQVAEGESQFVFVANLTDDERDQAMADAFKKAKLSAARLAKAAGAQLGELVSLTSQNQAGFAGDQYEYNYAYRQQLMASMGLMANTANSPDSQEAFGAQPGKVVVNVAVNATFRLK